MAAKLLAMNVCDTDRLVLWILDILVQRTQSVRYQTAVSSSRSISAGSPQGTVLSPVLFTFYTNDCKLGNDTTLLIKYSDDSAIEDLSNSDTTYKYVQVQVTGTVLDRKLNVNANSDFINKKC